MSRISVLGAGAWGTTLAQVLSDAENEVLIWGRRQEVVTEINQFHTNYKYLPEVQLHSKLMATMDEKAAFAYSDLYVLAIPAQNIREKLRDWKQYVKPETRVISTLKGIELTTQKRMTEVIQEEWGLPLNQIALITGPNLASELALRQPAAAVAACTDINFATQVQDLFTTNYYRVYTSTDVVGCEFAGAIKNIVAIAVGMAVGMDLGENTQAMLMTRGSNELARLCAAHHADPLSALGLAGMGDMIASCGSPLSRNRTFGEVLGRTGSMRQTRDLVAKTAEGVASSSAAVEIAHRVGVEVPVLEAVADVVNETISPREAIKRLMEISVKAESFTK